MKKFTIILLGLCFLVNNEMFSQRISVENAQRVAENFFSEIACKSSIPTQVLPLGKRDRPAVYAISSSNSWVLIAGDKRVRPILAYSEANSGVFPAEEDRPDGMSFMLGWYIEQIDALVEDNTIVEPNPQWEAYLTPSRQNSIDRSVVVEPLLSRNGYENIWKQIDNNTQGEPDITKTYNKFCPAVHDLIQNCDHAVVGCSALATSQIMWYWQWPYATIVKDDNANQLLRIYNWELMPYSLTNFSSLDEADMVANLLHDVGVAINTTYGCPGSYGSSAIIDSISQQLRNRFFYYADNVINRSSYTNSVWINMIKSNLDTSFPIIYSGMTLNGNEYSGHTFVLDGYNTDNMFHMNFGWGGDNNSYYSLDAINIDIYHQYNHQQSMIKNIHPHYPSCSPFVVPSNDFWPTNFVLLNGGSFTIGNRVITSGMQGTILSGESVTLTSGFEIEAGANVYIAVEDMHCDDDRGDTLDSDEETSPLIPHAPHKQNVINDPPSASKILRDGQILILRGDKTYTLTGQEVK